ncbi:DUF3618 domain-containing protein [Actinoplanes xinjiangensis]|uniref:Uncharacterized protein DUF3618 n=1 Tax=Actinoplanes xinjiangensis TaxID=512350 RepID=A0A316FSL6_9ACTN|nr:DUF3618 domain-containing protein [Actinoplanes xinjiangensis]PWK42774.1 uncharacterized protein DUF3618 [Actinoplanes xinjiangensis]GIF38338.1 hypothetical protein Axi01nite_26490 [Actinoplanes xinjiangensis]
METRNPATVPGRTSAHAQTTTGVGNQAISGTGAQTPMGGRTDVQNPGDTGRRIDPRADSGTREAAATHGDGPGTTRATGPTGSEQGRTSTNHDEDVHAAAELARNGQGDDPAEALRAEIEQTRAEMGETAAALVAKLDVPSRMKEAAAEKKTQFTEAVAEKKAQLTEAAAETKDKVMEVAAEKKNQLTGTATDAEPGRIRQAAAGAAGSIAAKAEAVTEAIHGKRTSDNETVTAGDKARAGSPSTGSRRVVTSSESSQARQESAETRTHLAEAAAEAAERATTAIGTLPARASEAIGTLRGRTDPSSGPVSDQMPDRRKRYALIGAALAMAAGVTVLIRRLR